MTTQVWTKEERQRLQSLGIDPTRSDREKLLSLRAHFAAGKSVYGVTEGRKIEPNISGDLARKVRNLTLEGKLDWLLSTVQTTSDSIKTAHLRLRSPRVVNFTDGNRVGRYATVEVANDSEVEAMQCWSWVYVPQTGIRVPLHYAGTEITAGESDAPRISINQQKPARLDVAVSMAAPGKIQSTDYPANVSGNVVIFSEKPQMPPWEGGGCWLAQPAALYNPDPRWESYLPPGYHTVTVTVGCLNGQGNTATYIITSPSTWQRLDIKEA